MGKQFVTGVDRVRAERIHTSEVKGGPRDGERGIAIFFKHLHPESTYPRETQILYLSFEQVGQLCADIQELLSGLTPPDPDVP